MRSSVTESERYLTSMDILAGTSGFAYDEWQGSFYPPGLPPARRLAYFAGRIGTVEINNTFYRMPKSEVLGRWYADTGPAFRFTLKASRRITHFAKLRGCQDSLDYLLNAAASLREKLAAVLFQLPPSMKMDLPCLRDFLACFPSGARATFEFRHPSWFDDRVFTALAASGAALGWNDDEEVDTPRVATASFGYVRLRRGDYTPEELHSWADQLRAQPWQAALVYFKHEENAWQQAERFAEGVTGAPMSISAWA